MLSEEAGSSEVQTGGETSELFERPGFRGAPAQSEAADGAPASSSASTGAAPPGAPPPPPPHVPQPNYFASPAPGSSLFDRYASEGAMRKGYDNGSTFTSRLRQGGIKLACYLNTEANRGRSTIIS